MIWKPVHWFLYDRELRNERVKSINIWKDRTKLNHEVLTKVMCNDLSTTNSDQGVLCNLVIQYIFTLLN